MRASEDRMSKNAQREQREKTPSAKRKIRKVEIWFDLRVSAPLLCTGVHGLEDDSSVRGRQRLGEQVY